MKKIIVFLGLSFFATGVWAEGFNGFNIGIGGAYYNVAFHVDIPEDTFTSGSFGGQGDLEANTGYFHAQAGYGHAFQRIYIGFNLFADIGQAETTQTISGSVNNQTAQISATSTLDNIYGLILKPGFVVTPKLLIYGLGGIAVSSQSLDVAGVSGIDDSHEATWLAGAGVEYLIASKLSVSGEWSYIKIDESSEFLAGLFGEPVVTQDTHANRVLLGVNYYF